MSNYITATDALADWRGDLMSGKAPTLYPLGDGDLGRIEVGPGLVTLIGGAPGAGKTAFTMQVVFDALRLTPTLRALVCNIEMPPSILMDRQLARLSGVDLTAIRYRKIEPEHADGIGKGIAALEAVADRLAFLRPPFDLAAIASAGDDFGASLLVLDYIQRIAPPGEHDSRRSAIDATMGYLRQIADAGVAVIIVSAVARSKDSRGRSSYAGDGLNLASFRETSELEFGADDAFILHPDDDDPENEFVTLKHLKSRHGECRTLALRFDRRRQTFTSELAPICKAEPTVTSDPLAELWSRTPTKRGRR